MAVEILERDRGVVVRELSGSDVAFDVHLLYVFLRAGLADTDSLDHVVGRSAPTSPTSPPPGANG